MSAYTRVHPIEIRLWDQTEIRESGCREFTGRTDRDGYGRLKHHGKPDAAHRVAWELTNGPIPDGLGVLHHCDNPPCCQTDPTEGYPDGHLFLGTTADNMADKAAKGRTVVCRYNAAKTHCPDGHPYDEANTYVDRKGHRTCKTCRRATTTRHRARVKAAQLVATSALAKRKYLKKVRDAARYDSTMRKARYWAEKGDGS